MAKVPTFKIREFPKDIPVLNEAIRRLCAAATGTTNVAITQGGGNGSSSSAYVTISVPFNAGAPVFDAASSLGATTLFTLTLTGNVASSTFVNAKRGQVFIFQITQDATGGRSFSWPANVSNPPVINTGTGASTYYITWFDGTNAVPMFEVPVPHGYLFKYLNTTGSPLTAITFGTSGAVNDLLFGDGSYPVNTSASAINLTSGGVANYTSAGTFVLSSSGNTGNISATSIAISATAGSVILANGATDITVNSTHVTVSPGGTTRLLIDSASPHVSITGNGAVSGDFTVGGSLSGVLTAYSIQAITSVVAVNSSVVGKGLSDTSGSGFSATASGISWGGGGFITNSDSGVTPGTYTLGAHNVTVDAAGRITNIV